MIIPQNKFFDCNETAKDYSYTCKFCGDIYLVAKEHMQNKEAASPVYHFLNEHQCGSPRM